VRLLVSASSGSSVQPPTPVTNERGEVAIRWTAGDDNTSQLYVTLDGVADSPSAVVLAARPGAVTASAVVNAASYAAELAPGAIATVYGVNLSTGGNVAAPYPWPTSLGGVRVTLDGRPLPLLFVSNTQINFLVPEDVPESGAFLVVSTPVADTAPIRVIIESAAPGIFFDERSGYGAVLNAGTALTTLAQPARRGAAIEIYCTGLGSVAPGASDIRETLTAPEVFIAGAPARVLFSGLAPGYAGLYQVNVEVPESIGSGEQPLTIRFKGFVSNTVRIGVQ
jgi:uncharacterized protein (TIGR03437 family)